MLQQQLDLIEADPFESQFFFSNDYDNVTNQGEWTRSTYSMGVPLSGYVSLQEDEDEQVGPWC